MDAAYEMQLIEGILDTEAAPGVTIRSLATMEKPGSGYAKSILRMLVQQKPEVGEAGRMAALAAEEYTDGIGGNGKHAIAENVWQQLCVMQAHSPLPKSTGSTTLM